MQSKTDNDFDWGRNLLNVTQCRTAASPEVVQKAIQLLLKDFQGLKSRIREPKTQNNPLIKFLDDYKNPCWVEELPAKPFEYNKTRFVPHRKRPKESRIQSTQTYMDPLLKDKQQGANGSLPYYRNGTRSRCLPYFFLAGMQKAGTTDLFAALIKHPLIEEPAVKEPYFWSYLIDHRYNSFDEYLDLFDIAADKITKHQGLENMHDKITFDATVFNWQGFRTAWKGHPWNKQTHKQCITLPQMLHQLLPNIKLIMIFREPISWIVSCYNYFAEKNISERILKQIGEINECLRMNDGLSCTYLLIKDADYCHVAHTMHIVFAKMWIKELGKKNVLVLNSSEYFKNRRSSLTKTFHFLGLNDLGEQELAELDTMGIQNKMKSSRKLTEKAKKELVKFVEPWEDLLADYLQDESFRWQKYKKKKS